MYIAPIHMINTSIFCSFPIRFDGGITGLYPRARSHKARFYVEPTMDLKGLDTCIAFPDINLYMTDFDQPKAQNTQGGTT